MADQISLRPKLRRYSRVLAVFVGLLIALLPMKGLAQAADVLMPEVSGAAREFMETHINQIKVMSDLRKENLPNALSAGRKVVALAKQELGQDHPLLTILHWRIATIMIGMPDPPFDELQRHLSRGVAIWVKRKGEIDTASAVILGSGASMSLSHDRYQEAETILSLLYQRAKSVYDREKSSQTEAVLFNQDLLKEFPGSNTTEYRAELRRLAVFYRAEKNERTALELEKQAADLEKQN